MVSAVLRDKHPLVLAVLRRTGSEGALDGVGRAHVLPVLGRLVILGAVGIDEEVEGLVGIGNLQPLALLLV